MQVGGIGWMTWTVRMVRTSPGLVLDGLEGLV